MFTRPQPSNPHLESGYTSLLLILLEVINRFHFYERYALRPLISIPEPIFKRGETLVKVEKHPQFLSILKGWASLRGSCEFFENLQLKDDSELTIIDTDAGIEHFGRGVERGVDIIIMVVDPSYESIQLAHKINSLAETISKPIYFVLNKVKAEIKDNLKNAVPSNKVIGVIPNNNEIFSSGFLGKEIDTKIEELDRLSEILMNILLTTKT